MLNPYEPPALPSDPADRPITTRRDSIVLFGIVAVGTLVGRAVVPLLFQVIAPRGPLNAFDLRGTISGPVVGGLLALALGLYLRSQVKSGTSA
jgi:hypothetical protein